jgi:hypothetical protein
MICSSFAGILFSSGLGEHIHDLFREVISFLLVMLFHQNNLLF